MEWSYGQIRDLLLAQVRAKWGQDPPWWLLDVWPDFAIIEAPDDRLYRISYSVVTPEGGMPTVSLGEELTPVQRIVEYLPLTQESVVVREALDGEGWQWDVVLVAPGLSQNGVYYPPEVLQAAVPLFEGVRALARGDAEHVRDQAVHAVNVVGWYDNVQWAEGVGVVGTFHITEDAEWLRAKLHSAWEAGKADLLGFSLVASGRGRRALYEGAVVTWVEALTKVDFVDVVVNPAAGGRVLQLVAGLPPTGLAPLTEDCRMLAQLLRLLESRRPDLYATIDPDHIDEAQVLALLDSAVPAPAPPAERLPARRPATLPATVPAAGGPAVADAEDRALHRLELIECKLTLREALIDVQQLPEFLRVRLRNQFQRRLDRGEVFRLEDLAEAVQDARQLCTHFSEAGKVVGMGATTAGARITEDDDEVRLQHLVDFFDGKTHSFKAAYISATGDVQVRASLRKPVQFGNWPRLAEARGLRLRASLDSTTFDAVLADVMHKRMVAEYQLPALNIWRAVVLIGSTSDFKTQHRTRFGGYGNLPIVGQGDAYTALTSPSDEEATFAPAKRGGTEDLTWEMIRNDDANAVRFIPIRLGRAAGQTILEFVFDFIASNPTIYDSVALFHANHSNLTSTAFGTDDTQFLVHRLAMQKQTEAGSAKRLGLAPKYLLIPPDLESGAYNAFKRTTNQDARFSQMVAPEILSVPHWTDTNNWFTVSDPMSCPTIEVAFLDGEEEPDIFVQDEEVQGTMFTADKRTYKVRQVYGGAVLDYRGMQGAIVS